MPNLYARISGRERVHKPPQSGSAAGVFAVSLRIHLCYTNMCVWHTPLQITRASNRNFVDRLCEMCADLHPLSAHASGHSGKRMQLIPFSPLRLRPRKLSSHSDKRPSTSTLHPSANSTAPIYPSSFLCHFLPGCSLGACVDRFTLRPRAATRDHQTT